MRRIKSTASAVLFLLVEGGHPSPALPKGKGEPYSQGMQGVSDHSDFTKIFCEKKTPFPLGRAGDGSLI
jgi:hypothetical protein